MRVKIVVSYDGSNYCGWQIQPNAVTIQEVLQNALFEITGEKSKIKGSGRTDAGVHALGQVAHFDTKSTIPAKNFYRAFNVRLPDDIKVLSSEQVDENFNACSSAKKKTYRFKTYVSQTILPLKDRYAVQLKRQPDLEKMKECAKILLGEHDFKCMTASGSGAKTTIRTIYSIEINQNGNEIDFTICGNGFLYNMVRIMVGTLIAVGNGKIQKQDVEQMLLTKKRSLGGKTLVAKGLTLMSVEY